MPHVQRAIRTFAPAVRSIPLDELITMLERSAPNSDVMAMLAKAREIRTLKKV